MKLTFVALFAATAALVAFTDPAESKHTNTLTVNADKSTVAWVATKVTGDSHHGTVGIKTGELIMDHGKLVGGNFVMNMPSIACTDLEGEYKGKLEGHLKSPDFFDVTAHPTASLKITKVAALATDKAGNNHTITGDLTIKGITHSISFPAKVSVSGETAMALAKIEIDRAKFDVKYGSGSFFEGLGDKLIDDIFTLDVNLAAGR